MKPFRAMPCTFFRSIQSDIFLFRQCIIDLCVCVCVCVCLSLPCPVFFFFRVPLFLQSPWGPLPSTLHFSQFWKKNIHIVVLICSPDKDDVMISSTIVGPRRTLELRRTTYIMFMESSEWRPMQDWQQQKVLEWEKFVKRVIGLIISRNDFRKLCNAWECWTLKEIEWSLPYYRFKYSVKLCKLG